MLKACMTRRDITPPKGLELAGYPHYPRNNEGCHDPLYAACMYLSNGETEVAMVSLDLLYCSKKYVAEVRRRVEEATGIPGDHVMISSTHTHSGPYAHGRKNSKDPVEVAQESWEYVQFLIATITELIVEGQKNAYPATFGYGTAMCGAESGVGGNRRIPGGPHDPLVSVMAIKDADDNLRGALVNYALHPTFIHEWSNVCTADYPCYVKLEIEEQNPQCLVGFIQGTSGNQSSRYYRQGESYDEAERVGRLLGKAALSALKIAQWHTEMPIATKSITQEIKFRDFGTVEEARARAAEDKANYEYLYKKYGQSTKREEYFLWQNANLKHLGSERQLALMLMEKDGARNVIAINENPVEVQVFRLGGCCVIGMPGEQFVEYGLYLKAMAGFGTVIVNEVTNGMLPGYMYTPQSLVTGGYEVGTSMLADDFGIILINAALNAARSLL